MAKFTHYDLRLINPPFDSELTTAVMDLDYLRRLNLRGDTPPALFFQLKYVFHLLESLGSARIEGNHTTLENYVESKIEGKKTENENLLEIENIEAAMDYIEKNLRPNGNITQKLIRELHQLTVKNLNREGDKTPGAYRQDAVFISQSDHKPPNYIDVQPYMDELENFINNRHPPQYDLLKIALAHHRFSWIHPFGNGNGRVVRLITYAMLIKFGFNVQQSGRILNPTAIFCNDRDIYFSQLAKADTGTDTGLHDWSLYVLSGMREELNKVDRLTKYDYLKDKILLPAIAYIKERKIITEKEAKIVSLAVEKREIKAGDLGQIVGNLKPHQRTYLIQKLVDRQMLAPTKPGGRSYQINFINNYLMRGIIYSLTREGFIPSKLSETL